MNLALSTVVLAAIQLNRQTQFRTVEIEDVRLDGMLAPELPSIHPTISKAGPQQSLSIRGVTSQLSGELNELKTFASDFVSNALHAIEHDIFMA